jgi:four helix bundle protein
VVASDVVQILLLARHDLREFGAFPHGKRTAIQFHMPTKADELRARTKRFAVQILMFVRTLPHTPEGITIARQLARSGTGISTNYHSAGRGRSRDEFIARLAVAVDEADETVNWLFKIEATGLTCGDELEALLKEAGELRAIFSAALATARRNRAADKAKRGRH